MKTTNILQFLDDLAKNNTFAWMHAHQKQYKVAKQEFLDLMQEVTFSLGKHNEQMLEIPLAKRISRLARDTRFSNDKSPYKTAFTMHLSTINAPIPCAAFVHLQPNMNFVGGGIFIDCFKEVTTRIRKAIVENEDEFMKIVNTLEKQNIEVFGTKLKNVPKEYDAGLSCSPYLKYKAWFIEVPLDLSDEQTNVQELVRCCQIVAPFNSFINKALEGYEIPKR